MILNLISGPRNVSTALMYSFAQRTDTHVLDEPFYAVFLSRTGVHHPGAEAVLQALPHGEGEVKKQVASLATGKEKPVLFVKNMAHHMEVLEEPLLEDAINVFLIRDPAQILASYSEVIAHPGMRDIGIAYQYELFCRLQKRGPVPIVLDSQYLLEDTVPVLTKLCLRCGLTFQQRMAHWPQGPKPYDGVWAPYWYRNVHATTGFMKPSARSRTLPTHLKSLCSEATPLYEKLRPFSIKA